MTAPFVWPPEAREAVARAMRETWRDLNGIRNETLDWRDIDRVERKDWRKDADTALAALAPFVAQIEAAAFRRGAEAMREKVAADIAHSVNDPGACAVERAVCRALVISTRALPIPEDKQP